MRVVCCSRKEQKKKLKKRQKIKKPSDETQSGEIDKRSDSFFIKKLVNSGLKSLGLLIKMDDIQVDDEI